jgi:MoaA/NifB/PqqE/SkfB family radical SAM enzyme
MGAFAKKVKLLAGLLDGEVAKTGPFFVDVDLTRRCNLRCLGCPYQQPALCMTEPHDLAVLDFPFHRFVKLCDELRATDTSGIVLQGSGEPLLHPHVFEMTAAAKRVGLHVVLLTNGTLLDGGNAAALLEAGPDILKVSLWATSPEEFVRNCPGSDPDTFGRVIDGLRRVAALKRQMGRRCPGLFVHFVINRHNLENLDGAIGLAAETGCDGIYFSPMHNFRDGLSDAVLSPDKWREAAQTLRGAAQRLRALGLGHNIDVVARRAQAGEAIWARFPCYVPWFHVRIRPDGAVQPCGRCKASVDFGNVLTTPFMDIWNGPGIRAFRHQTLARDWYRSVVDACDCRYCSFLGDIDRVHRLARWFSPVIRRARTGSRCCHS